MARSVAVAGDHLKGVSHAVICRPAGFTSVCSSSVFGELSEMTTRPADVERPGAEWPPSYCSRQCEEQREVRGGKSLAEASGALRSMGLIPRLVQGQPLISVHQIRQRIVALLRGIWNLGAMVRTHTSQTLRAVNQGETHVIYLPRDLQLRRLSSAELLCHAPAHLWAGTTTPEVNHWMRVAARITAALASSSVASS